MKERKVLIIDDNESFRDLVKDTLQPQGYIIFEASSANEGILKLNKIADIKVILLDLNLRPGSGEEFLDRIKENSSYYKIIIISGDIDETQRLYPKLSENYKISSFLSKGDTDIFAIRLELGKIFNIIEAQSRIQIFISYASEDYPQARFIYDALRNLGFAPLMDKTDFLVGDEWKVKIEKLINKCDFFLACFSSNSINKEGIVQVELKMALDRQAKMPDSRTFIMPIRLDNCNVPDKFKRWHSLDLFELNADAINKLKNGFSVTD